MNALLIEAKGLARRYAMRRGLLGRPAVVHAVDGVSLRLARGETLGIVGESGSGKSTTGRMVLGLEPPDAGTVTFDGSPMPALRSTDWRRSRARMQMIFQDPLGALDRRLPVADQIREPLDIHASGLRPIASTGSQVSWTRSASRPPRRAATRTNSPAGSASAS